MKKIFSSLRFAVELLHSYFSPVVVLFFFDEAILIFYISRTSASHFIFNPLFLGICFVARVLITSGTYGTLVELCSGEKYCVSLKNFGQNIRALWLPSLVLQIVKIGLLMYCASLDEKANLFLVGVCLDLPLLFLMAMFIIHKKYHARTGFSWKKTKFFIPTMVLFILVCALEIFITFGQNGLHLKYYKLFLVSFFLLKYLHVLLFILVAKFLLDGITVIGNSLRPAKEIFLIHPIGGGSLRESVGSIISRLYPPIFSVIKALTPPEYTISTFSRVLWRRRYFKPDVLVGITCYTSNCYSAYKIAKEFRKLGAKVVLGGPHVSCMPDEAMQFCDSIVVGEAEGVWETILSDYEQNTLKAVYHGVGTDEQYKKVHQYLMQAPIDQVADFLETSRGCKFRCSFCAVGKIYQGRIRQKPLIEVMELVRRVSSKKKSIHFSDSNIFINPEYTKQLFNALLPLKVKWSACCSIDIAANDELLRLAKESGCCWFLIGYEITEGSAEKKKGGKFQMAEKYVDYTRRIRKAGIKIKGHFIIGFDTDGYEDILGMWKFCLSIFPAWAIVSILTPLPGTEIFQDMVKNDRVMNANWKWYTCLNLVLQPKRMNYKVLKTLYPFVLYICLFTTSINGWFLIMIAIFLVKLAWFVR